MLSPFTRLGAPRIERLAALCEKRRTSLVGDEMVPPIVSVSARSVMAPPALISPVPASVVTAPESIPRFPVEVILQLQRAVPIERPPEL